MRALPQEHKQYLPASLLGEEPEGDKPAATTPPENKGAETPNAAAHSEQGDTEAEPSKATEADTNKGEPPAKAPPPSSEPALDLSDIPEAIRSVVAALPRAAQQEIRDNWLRRDRFNRGLQEQAEAVKKAQADTADAEKWRKVAANQRAAQAALDALNAKDEPEDDVPDPITSSREEWMAWAKRERERAYKAGQAAAESFFREKIEAPKERASATEREFSTFAQELGVPDDEAVAIAEKAIAHYEKSGFLKRNEWNPQHVRALLPPFFAAAMTAGNKPSVPANVTPPMPKVAAPGRGGGVPAPPPLPRFMREGRSWPGTDEERAEYAVYLANQADGGHRTVAELEEAINGSTRGR